MKNQAPQEFTVGSLFAGIGGFCTAFKKQGFNIIWANEIDPFASKTYRNNHHEVHLYEQSIEDLRVIDHNILPVDVLTAGFPCQPFSVAGYKKGFNDPRGKLFFQIIRLLKEYGSDRPKILVMENVKNLLNHDNGKTFDRMMEEIKAAGYWFSRSNVAVLNTKDHTAIPQNRERLYMVALSTKVFDYNSFIFPEPIKELEEVRNYLDLQQKGEDDLYFDENSKYGKMFVESMSSGNPNSVYLLRRFYVRENKSQTVFTLTANMGEGGHNVPVIKDAWGIRKLSPRECLRLQGFDDKFKFPPDISRSQQYRQIGNAVTVPLVEILAKQCHQLLIEIGGDDDN